MSRFALYITALCIAAAAASCVTGIDSTPRVTAADVKRQAGDPSAEQLFLSDVKPQPLSQWQAGKWFYVTDDKIKLTLGATAPAEPLAGASIAYAGRVERSTQTGARVTDLLFITPQGGTVTYTVQQPLDEILEQPRVEIPFTIEESVVEAIAAKMAGNTYFLLSPDCYDMEGNNRRRRKFVPVVIKKVSPGNSVYPISVIFSEAGADAASDADALAYMGLPGGSVGPQFDALFSFADPRERYRSISDEAWSNIIANTVALDMTREECRLALGAPSDVNRWSTGSYLVEIWTYDSGSFLRFEDGRLKTFRK